MNNILEFDSHYYYIYLCQGERRQMSANVKTLALIELQWICPAVLSILGQEALGEFHESHPGNHYFMC